MSESSDGPTAEAGARAVLGKLIPWLLLVIVTWIALGFYGNYRQEVRDSKANGSQETTANPDSETTTDAAAPAEGEGAAATEGPMVVVLIDGLNLRTKPQTSAAVIKKLDKDARLTLIEQSEGWYHVRDPGGDEGFVAAGGQYTKLVE